MPYAHPTVEHYTPLFVTLGAATTPDEPGIQVIDGFWMGLVEAVAAVPDVSTPSRCSPVSGRGAA